VIRRHQVRVLSLRALNRAMLERQLLLRRRRMPALAAVEHLVGLQAQLPNPPYIALWTRLEGFAVGELSQLVHDRKVVRAVLLRATQHLTAAPDFLSLRPLLQPVLDRGRQAAMGRLTAGMDLAELAATGRELLRGRTLTRPQLRALLAERWPDRDPDALAWSVQYLVPLVHVPPGITWRTGGGGPLRAGRGLARPSAAGGAFDGRPDPPVPGRVRTRHRRRRPPDPVHPGRSTRHAPHLAALTGPGRANGPARRSGGAVRAAVVASRRRREGRRATGAG
jgi:DNA glycosylase AlkZ-like